MTLDLQRIRAEFPALAGVTLFLDNAGGSQVLRRVADRVRDYLLTLAWDRTPPAPALPPDIVARTQAKYLEAYELLTGRPL